MNATKDKMYTGIVTLVLFSGLILTAFGQERQNPTNLGSKNGVLHTKQGPPKLKPFGRWDVFLPDTSRIDRVKPPEDKPLPDSTKARIKKPGQHPVRQRDANTKPWLNTPVDTSMRR